MKKIAIWGWWQGNNLGDNWIKAVLKLIFPYADFINTRVTDFKEYDFVICGGGGLFIYDVISPWKQYTQKIPFGMLGLGAEFPHKSNTAYELAKRADFFLVRDEYSLNCMHVFDVERSYDITFAYPLNRKEEQEINLSNLYFIWRDGKELISNEQFKSYICYEDIKEKWTSIVESEFDRIKYDDFQTDVSDISERMKEIGFVISGRYHGIVAAIQNGVPFLAIDICPKIRALLIECGLEEYCIKISEVDKARDLIRLAKRKFKLIREKEEIFCRRANLTLQYQLDMVKSKIFKIVFNLKILHYGSYWMGKNDVVNTMSDDLIPFGEIIKIDLNIYHKPNKRVKTKISTQNGCLCILDANLIIDDINYFKPDCIILNSGGLTMEDEAFYYAKKKGVKVIGISLSDPDVYPYNGQLYADKYDLFYTNSKYAYINQYDRKRVNINLLPFAASTQHHYYMPKVKKIYDIVVIGHARKERLEIVEKLSKYFKVGTFGHGWGNSLGEVHGVEHVAAINSGKMYLSFSKTIAGFNNVKVGLFEAMACNQVVITEYMDELNDYFEINKEILCYRDEAELIKTIAYYISHDEERERIRANAYRHFLSSHTYTKRWEQVMKDIIDLDKMVGEDYE